MSEIATRNSLGAQTFYWFKILLLMLKVYIQIALNWTNMEMNAINYL